MLEFKDIHILPRPQRQASLSQNERTTIQNEVKKLSANGVISACTSVHGEFVSPVFTVPKKDGSHRMILNLKALNEEMPYRHFKMETLHTALQLVTPNCFMASVDLKDAYFSIAVADDHKKYLRFRWNDELFQFNCLAQGACMAPRIFTKLLKPVFATLREKGFLSTSFLDDSLLFGNTSSECLTNVTETIHLLRSLGFIVHPSKSVLHPTQRIQYLGFIIDSVSMTVTLTPERVESVKQSCSEALKSRVLSVRTLAQVIGKIVASFPAVKHGPLHYRHLDWDKTEALKMHKGNFDCPVRLSEAAKTELEWWLSNITHASNDISLTDPDITVFSDASDEGWGCECESARANGTWLPVEAAFQINYRELKAGLFALQSFLSEVENKHVRLMMDNTTAVACVNHMGTSHSRVCNEITFTIWQWCLQHNVWISAAFIPGKENTAADYESRHFNWDAEWKLDTSILRDAFTELGVNPTVDLFASRVNAQLPRYASYRPDPEAFAVDAFSLSWRNLTVYAFPPFSVILPMLRKMLRDGCEGVVIVPKWPTQPWWPLLQRISTRHIALPTRPDLLSLPSRPRQTHRLLQQARPLRLLACKISTTD